MEFEIRVIEQAINRAVNRFSIGRSVSGLVTGVVIQLSMMHHIIFTHFSGLIQSCVLQTFHVELGSVK